ncbi:MAG: hypothetical protein R3C14_26030 [Caldilineaceae bacterium]
MIKPDLPSSTPSAIDTTPLPTTLPATSPATPEATASSEPLTLSDQVDEAAMPLVALASEHLASKLSIPVDQIFVFTVEPMTWPDSNLGCPQSGLAAAQVETPGYSILLEAGGKTYNYHTDAVDRVILCEARGPGEIYNPP